MLVVDWYCTRPTSRGRQSRLKWENQSKWARRPPRQHRSKIVYTTNWAECYLALCIGSDLVRVFHSTSRHNTTCDHTDRQTNLHKYLSKIHLDRVPRMVATVLVAVEKQAPQIVLEVPLLLSLMTMTKTMVRLLERPLSSQNVVLSHHLVHCCCCPHLLPRVREQKQFQKYSLNSWCSRCCCCGFIVQK